MWSTCGSSTARSTEWESCSPWVRERGAGSRPGWFETTRSPICWARWRCWCSWRPGSDVGHFRWLTFVTFAPLAGALVLAFFPRRAENLHRVWALVVTVATFALSIGMLFAFHPGTGGFGLMERV